MGEEAVCLVKMSLGRVNMTRPKLQAKSKCWNHNHSFGRPDSKPQQTSLNPVDRDGNWIVQIQIQIQMQIQNTPSGFQYSGITRY